MGVKTNSSRNEALPKLEESSSCSLLRERFKQRCFERAQRAREAKIKSGRKHLHYFSDGEDLEMDDDEEEADEFLNDEV